MNLKDIVCDFEYADRLSELGLGSYKGSLFFFDSTGRLVTAWHNVTIASYTNTYTVAELGDMLPKVFKIESKGSHIIVSYKCNISEKATLYIKQVCGLGAYEDKFFQDKKEANARAKLLIFLIENNHVNVEELNK